MFVVFVFFKQKTAYEMRISDWSSDVCSSDLFSLFNNGAYVPGEKVDATLDGDVPALMLDRHTLSFVAPAVGASATASVTATLAEGAASPLSATLEIEVAPPATPDPAVEYPPASSVGL